MTKLYNKVFEFRCHFNITSDFAPDQEFRLDEEGNLLAKWKANVLTVSKYQLAISTLSTSCIN